MQPVVLLDRAILLCCVSCCHASVAALQADSLDVSERQPAFLKDKGDALAAQGNYRFDIAIPVLQHAGVCGSWPKTGLRDDQALHSPGILPLAYAAGDLRTPAWQHGATSKDI
jgi:hypothetical protein